MRKIKIKARSLFKYFFLVLAIAILISAPILIEKRNTNTEAVKSEDMTVLNIWQIDSFEGGKGSRAVYLQNVGDSFYKEHGCYVKVISLTSDAVRENLKNNIVPDLISYGAGTFGLESHIRGKIASKIWCCGSYCFLTLDTNSNFDDIKSENTVINGGTENFSRAAALVCGIGGADADKPTGAYVKLINGKYKYLLGTQRDIFRLRARGVPFKIKPITEFNDLYQNISVTSPDAIRQTKAQQFIDFLMTKSGEISKLGLMADGQKLYEDEMSALEGLVYDLRLTSPVSEQTKNEINEAIANNDVKKLKNLFN